MTRREFKDLVLEYGDIREHGQTAIATLAAIMAEYDRLAASPSPEAPHCATCQRPATCGHGNEDGRCFRLPARAPGEPGEAKR